MNTFHYIFYTGQPSVGISYWAQKSGVGRPKLHGHWSVGLPALPYKWHCQNFKLAWLKEHKTIEELRLAAAVQRN